MNERTYQNLKCGLIFLFFAVCFFTAVFLRTEDAPDEAMRYLVPQYLITHHTLPNGMEPEVRSPIWGFSYALYPYLPSIISAVFMEITSVFTVYPHALLVSARMVSVVSGTAVIYMLFRIGELLFLRRETVLFFAAVTGFLPQFVFLGGYLNNDMFALFTASIMIYYWLMGIKTAWNCPSCVGLGIGCGLCSLSYYNFYALFVGGILLFFLSLRHYGKNAKEQITRFLLIFAAACMIGGWFFLRNAVIHEGDFLGNRTASASAEQYAEDPYKPSARETPEKLGLSFSETFLKTYPGRQSNWVFSTVCSFIGSFSYMTVHLSMYLYVFYAGIFFFGLVGFIRFSLFSTWWKYRQKRYLFLAMVLTMVITVFLAMYNTYFSDYQSQGRYLMPLLIPLMILISDGYESLVSGISGFCQRRFGKTDHESAAYTRKFQPILLIFTALYLALFAVSYLFYLAPNCLAVPALISQ